MDIMFDEVQHKYWLDGIEAVSVTQLLKITGIAPDLGNFYTVEAQKRGTAVHKATELIDKRVQDIEDYLDSPYLPYIQGWVQFVDDCNFEPLAVEKMVGNFAWLIAGTFDRVGKVNGVETMVDIKTGAKQRHHGVQLAAYNVLDGNCKTRPRMTVQLFQKPKHGRNYELVPYTDPEDYDAFTGAAALEWWKRRNVK